MELTWVMVVLVIGIVLNLVTFISIVVTAIAARKIYELLKLDFDLKHPKTAKDKESEDMLKKYSHW